MIPRVVRLNDGVTKMAPGDMFTGKFFMIRFLSRKTPPDCVLPASLSHQAAAPTGILML